MDSTTGSFVVIPASFCKQPDMPYSAFRLFVYLCSCADIQSGNTDVCPSYDNIQQMTGLSRISISKGLKWLESHGWLKKKKRFSGSTIYTLTMSESIMHQKTDSTSI